MGTVGSSSKLQLLRDQFSAEGKVLRGIWISAKQLGSVCDIPDIVYVGRCQAGQIALLVIK
jgi:uncharacterized protein with ACT and thioredoxin-like domain